MLIGTIKDRVWATTTTIGTGTYSSAGPKAGYLDVSEVGNGVRSTWLCTDNVDWELFYGTVTTGTPKTVTRDSIIRSSNSNAPVDWTAGTRNLINVPFAQDVVFRNRSNVYEANQDLDGFKLITSADGVSYVWSASNTTMEAVISTTAKLSLGSTGNLTWTWTDATATIGPDLILYRDSSTPAAADPIGRVLAQGKDSGGNITSYGSIDFAIVTATNGSEEAKMTLRVANGSGVNSTAMELHAQEVIIGFGGTHNLYVGKSSHDDDSHGIELYVNSGAERVSVRGHDNIAGIFGRDSDGTLMSWRVNSVAQGSISVSGTTVTYGTFSGSHWSWWAKGFEPETLPPLGTVLFLCEEDYVSFDGERGHLGAVRIGDAPKSKAVYGVFGGIIEDEVIFPEEELNRRRTRRPRLDQQYIKHKPHKVEEKYDVIVEMPDGSKKVATATRKKLSGKTRVKFYRIIVNSVGIAPNGILVAGPCELGDPLISGDIPGTAVAAPEGTDPRYWVGYAGVTKTDDAVRAIRGTLCKG